MSDTMTDTKDRDIAALKAMRSKKERVLYACRNNPHGPFTASVMAWLEEHGQAVSRQHASPIIIGYRREAGILENTGDIPVITDEVIRQFETEPPAGIVFTDFPTVDEAVTIDAEFARQDAEALSDDLGRIEEQTLFRDEGQRQDTVSTVNPGYADWVEPARQIGSRSLLVLVAVLLLVNAAAIWGQAGWALKNIVPVDWLTGPALTLALAFAAALELIGVFLAMMADEGDAIGLPSGGIRLASYAVGLVSGSLNFSHWVSHGVAAAVAFSFLSAVSPFLWGIWSRVRRGKSAAPSRRFWHPIRSITLIRYMAWRGIVDEAEGIRAMPNI